MLRTVLLVFASLLLIADSLSQDSLEKGFLKFSFNSDSALVVVDNNYKEALFIFNGDSIELKAGNRIIDLSRPFSRRIRTNVIIDKDKTTIHAVTFSRDSISIENLSLNYATKRLYEFNTFLLTDADSDIYFNGNYIGSGLGWIDLPLGINFLEVKNSDFGTKKVKISGYPFLNVNTYYMRPSYDIARNLAFIPGASQFYKRQYVKSSIFATLFPSSVVFTILSGTKYNSEKELFKSYRKRYRLAENQSDALFLGDLTEKQQETTRKARTQFQIGAAATFLIYFTSMIDAYRSIPKGGYRKIEPLNFYLSRDTIAGINYNSATFRFNIIK